MCIFEQAKSHGINKTYSVVCLFVHLKMTFMLFMLSKRNFNEGSYNSGSAGPQFV